MKRNPDQMKLRPTADMKMKYLDAHSRLNATFIVQIEESINRRIAYSKRVQKVVTIIK